jgi:hypothetical protein
LFVAEGERAGNHQLGLMAEAGDVDIAKISLLATPPQNPWKGFFFGTLTTTLAREGHARMLGTMTDVVELTKLPPQDQGAAEAKLDKESWDFTVGDDELGKYMFFAELDKRVRGMPGMFRVNLALLRCAIVAVAAERYRLVHKRWPDKVEELAHGSLPPWATDPFGGGPIGLERGKDGLTVYSRGKDPGSEDLAEPKRRRSVDVRPRIRLFDVEQRRLPPPANASEDRAELD